MSAVLRAPSKLTNTTVFTANKPPRNAAALDVVTGIQGCVVVVANLPGGFALIKSAVKGLNLSSPELEVACGLVTVAREGNLGWSTRKHVQNFPVLQELVMARHKMQ